MLSKPQPKPIYNYSSHQVTDKNKATSRDHRQQAQATSTDNKYMQQNQPRQQLPRAQQARPDKQNSGVPVYQIRPQIGDNYKEYQ
jgi:hypothetical protein